MNLITNAMATFNISLNDELAQIVDEEMKKKKFANRSEFFRDLIRTVYLEKIPFEIEPVLPGDPDYEFVEKRMKNAKYVTFDELMKSK